MTSQEQFTIDDEEWSKILSFCSGGQTVVKRTDWGRDHKRKLQIIDGNLTWQTGSIPLECVRFITVGDVPSKHATMFFRHQGTPETMATIGSTERELHVTFSDVRSRNFWIKAITLHLALMPDKQRRFPETYQQLQAVLESTGDKMERLTFSVDGAVRAKFLTKFRLETVDVPTVDDNATSATSTFEMNYHLSPDAKPRRSFGDLQLSVDEDTLRTPQPSTTALTEPTEPTGTVILRLPVESPAVEEETKPRPVTPEEKPTPPNTPATSEIDHHTPSVRRPVVFRDAQLEHKPEDQAVPRESMPTPTPAPKPIVKSPSAPKPALKPAPKPKKAAPSGKPKPTHNVPEDVARKLAQSHGVDSVSKMTQMLMRSGEVFRTYVDGAENGAVQRVNVNASNIGLVGADLLIPFAKIVAIRTGCVEDVPAANPLHSFELEYIVFDNVKRRVVFEVVDERSPAARRNFWINGILSHIAESANPRLPQSVAQLNKLIGTVTTNTTQSLVLMPLGELLQRTASSSFDTTHSQMSAETTRRSINGRPMPEASEAAEEARRRAARRVSRVIQFQKKRALSHRLSRHSNEPEPAEVARGSKASSKHRSPSPAHTEKQLTVEIPVEEDEQAAESVAEPESPRHQQSDEEHVRETPADHMAEAGWTPQSTVPATGTSSPKSAAEIHSSSATADTAAHMRDDALRETVTKLTSALGKMEQQQKMHSDAMKKLAQREAISRKAASQKEAHLLKQIKKLKQEKTAEAERNDNFMKQLRELQGEQKMRKWKARVALETRCEKLTAERHAVALKLRQAEDKLGKAEKAFHITNTRLQKELAANEKQREQRAVAQAEQISELQGMKSRVQALTEKSKKLKEERRSLRHQVALRTKDAESWAKQFKVEARTSTVLREQVTDLQKETAMIDRLREKLRMAEQWMSEHEHTNAQLKETKGLASKQSHEMKALHHENAELMNANAVLQQQLTELRRSTSNKVSQLREQLDAAAVKRDNMEKLYQTKLRDLTEFAQQQMLEQQQLLMGTTTTRQSV